MTKVNLGAAIMASFAFIGTAWRRAGGIMVILVVYVAAMQAIAVSLPTLAFLTLVLGGIISLFVSAAAIGALYRIGVEDTHFGDPAYASRPAGLQWGALEWRVLGANFIFGMIYFAAALVFAITWVIGLAATFIANPSIAHAFQTGDQPAEMAAMIPLMMGPAGVVTAVIAIPAFLVIGFLSARLMLYAVMAADTGSLDIGRAWVLTRGAVITLMVAGFLFLLLQSIIGVILFSIGASLTGAIGTAGQLWSSIISGAIGAAIFTPLLAGLAIYAYRVKTGAGGADLAATFS